MRILTSLALAVLLVAAVAFAQTVTLNPDGALPRGRVSQVTCDAGVCTETSPAGGNCASGAAGFNASGCKATVFTVSAPSGKTLTGGTPEYWFCNPAADAGWSHNASRDKTIANESTRSQTFGPFFDPAGFNASRVHIRLNGVIVNNADAGVSVELIERCCVQGEGC